jgi:TolA-binding protein
MRRHLFVALVLPFVFFGCFKTREEIAREKEQQDVQSTLQQNIVQNNEGLDAVKADLGRLQGRMDELEHNRKKEMNGFAESQEKQQKSLAAAVDELSKKVASLQEAQNALFEEVKKLHEDALVAPARVGTIPKKKGSSSAKAPAAPASFDNALTAYKARDYASASAGFRAYLEASPKAKKALDAHYYLGDSLFKQKQYEQAVVEFGTVQEKTPTSFYGRRSSLRLAQSFKAMGKTKDAKAFAQLLIDASPDSEEAKTARKMFK